MIKHFTHLCQHLWTRQTQWTRFWHTLFVDPVRGNPMHEAWDQHGEPLPRLRPSDIAQSSSFCNGIHARGI